MNSSIQSNAVAATEETFAHTEERTCLLTSQLNDVATPFESCTHPKAATPLLITRLML